MFDYEKHKQNVKKWQNNNLEYVKEYKWLWFQKKRFHIKCGCGSMYLKHNQKNHFKTNKHKKFIFGVKPKNNKITNSQEIITNSQEIITNSQEVKKYSHNNPFVKGFVISWS